MRKVDLHIHTNFSDGLMSPKQILELAKENDFALLSITDHDTLDGYREAKKIIHEYDFEMIPGVEVSSHYKDKDIHILGYNVDAENKKLNQLLDQIHEGRETRAKKIISKLAELDLLISLDKVKDLAGEKGLIGRPHIARALVEAGYCKNTIEVFDNYIGDGCPAFVAKPAPSVKKVIKAIKKAGGVSVIAHPYIIQDDFIVEDIIKMGVNGLEVYCAKSDLNNIRHYEEIALEHNLLRTGGSDFHGDEYEKRFFGKIEIPDFVLKALKFKGEL